MRDFSTEFPRLIQAGMGVRVSGFRLANVTARLGALGVVSGVGLRHVVVEEVRRGDPALIDLVRLFPIGSYVEELLAFAPGGRWHDRKVPSDDPDPARGDLPRRLSTIATWVEVKRAQAGHLGAVGVNVMWKCALTVLPTIYGAMLAGASVLLCGAGVPMEACDIVTRLRAGEDLAYMPLTGTGTNVRLSVAADGSGPLLAGMPPPHILPILSNYAFPRRILDVWQREMGGARPSAFVLEDHRAGGHNAPPRNHEGFGEKDDIETYFDRVVGLGVPVFVAGGFAEGGSRNDLLRWVARGAHGIQVGSRFALCNESGLRDDLRESLIHRSAAGEAEVQTGMSVSPTGYPFKVVPLAGTLTDPAVYAARRRVCDKKYLVTSLPTRRDDGTEGEVYVCPAMPEAQFVALGGNASETEGKVCLCNALLATVGFADAEEPPIVTLGMSGLKVTTRMSARQIVEEILTPEWVAERERELAI